MGLIEVVIIFKISIKPMDNKNSDAIKRAFKEFKEEIDRIWKLEGIDWIVEKTSGKVTKDDIKAVTAPGSYQKLITGNSAEDKEFIAKFKELFYRQRNNKDIIHNLLYQIMPDSMKALSKEIDEFLTQINPATGKRNTWADFEDKTGIIRQGIYFHIKGYHYPERETIDKLRVLISDKTADDLLRELYGLNVEQLQQPTITPNVVKQELGNWQDKDKIETMLAIASGLKDCGLFAKTLSDLMIIYNQECVAQTQQLS